MFIIKNHKKKTLKNRILKLASGSEELKFLVGYFYFSGMHEIYGKLQETPDIKINILVGMNVDEKIKDILSAKEKTENLFLSMKTTFKEADFDKKEAYGSFRHFVEMIEQGKIVIRKTREACHAKLYIFKLGPKNIVRQNLFITGSSNLTKAGLTTQNEFNIELSDSGFEEVEEYFDELWKDSIKITEDSEVKKRLLAFLKEETHFRKTTPLEAYAYVLKTYLDAFEGRPTSAGLEKLLKEKSYAKYSYQLDAVGLGCSIIEKHRGLILADVVGLGKTIIACAIAYELKKRRGIVICPPAIAGDAKQTWGWTKYLEDFELTNWKVFSLGDLGTAADVIQGKDEYEIVIVDEAHRFRNSNSLGYEKLKNICRGRIAILLTATPFNNKPQDILSLLSLFITPKKSSIDLQDGTLLSDFANSKNIFGTFSPLLSKDEKDYEKLRNIKEIKKLYKENFDSIKIEKKKVQECLSKETKKIRRIIEPITIRRNRLDLKNNPRYSKEMEELGSVEDPQEWFFELSPEQVVFYDKTISRFLNEAEAEEAAKQGANVPEVRRFKGAIYKPEEYEGNTAKTGSSEHGFSLMSQQNLSDFIRRLVVKRFESSFGAFEKSIRSFKKITEQVEKFLEKSGTYVLDRKLVERIYELDEEEIENEINDWIAALDEDDSKKKLRKNKVYKVNNFKRKKDFFEAIRSDILLFEEILEELEDLKLTENDPKAITLAEKVKGILNKTPEGEEPQRKVIIFSEYIATVEHLEKKLEREFGNSVFVVKKPLGKKKLEELNANFDATYKEPANDFNILLCSDRMSEGFNFNRAGIVINYDIPWNPVRVIQRVGRINRISKKVFDKLYIANFFPTEKGAMYVRSREIASQKMFLIHKVLGEDSKIFNADEIPTASNLYTKVQRNPEDAEVLNFYNNMLVKYEKLKEEHPQLIAGLNKFPKKLKTCKVHENNELFVFIKKDRLYAYRIPLEKGEIFKAKLVDFEDVEPDICCLEKAEKPLPLSEEFWKAYDEFIKEELNKKQLAKLTAQEHKAYNVLKFIKSWEGHRDADVLSDSLKAFITALLVDIQEYGSLATQTLKRIAGLKKIAGAKLSEENKDKLIRELESMKTELGGNSYIQKRKQKLELPNKEIIVAIENKIR